MTDRQLALSDPLNTPVDTKLGRVDVNRALKLRLVNKLSYQEIANQFNVSRQCIHQSLGKLTRLLQRTDVLDAYRSEKANLLEAVEWVLVSNLVDREKVKKASLNNVAFAAEKVNTMIRLERGESTSNITYIDMTKTWAMMKQEREKMEAELGLDDTANVQDEAE